MSKAVTADDKKFKAENDARTLADAHAIQQDSNRLKAAMEAAKGLKKDMRDHAEESGKSADAMEALASQMYPTMGQGGGDQGGNQ